MFASLGFIGIVGVTFAFPIAGTSSIGSSTKKVLALDIRTVPPKKGNKGMRENYG